MAVSVLHLVVALIAVVGFATGRIPLSQGLLAVALTTFALVGQLWLSAGDGRRE